MVLFKTSLNRYDDYEREKKPSLKIKHKSPASKTNNSSRVENYDQDNVSKYSLNQATPKDKLVERYEQNMKRYKEVNISVEAHLAKFQHLIPDIKRKKIELLNDILGEKTYKEISEKMKQDRNKSTINRIKEIKRQSACEMSTDDAMLKKYKHQSKIMVNSPRDSKPLKVQNKSHQKSFSPTDLKYTPHKGKISESYQSLGGLGSNVGDEKWSEVYSRRKAMLNFSFQVNQKNKEVIKTKNPENGSGIIGIGFDCYLYKFRRIS